MQTTPVYLYHQRYRVILLDVNDSSIFRRRHEQVYTKNLKAHKGTDNRILIEFVNQDQKPVPLTDMILLCRLISRDGENLLLEKELTVVNEEKGQAVLTLTEQELDEIPSQRIHFSIEQINTLNEPVYVDDHAGARGNIEVLDSIMPKFVSSDTLTFPSPGVNVDYLSSIVNTKEIYMHTFQINVTDFSGTITINGATDADDDEWYEIITEDFIDQVTPIGINVVGFHPYLQISVEDNTTGTIDNVLYR